MYKIKYKSLLNYQSQYQYRIINVHDLCKPLGKRYRATVALKKDYPQTDIKNIITEVTEQIRSLEMYSNQFLADRFKDTPASVVWLYVNTIKEIDKHGCSDSWLCRSTYYNEENDIDGHKPIKPYIGKYDEIVDNLYIQWS